MKNENITIPKLQKLFIEMKEIPFTKNVLIPYLEALGTQVDHNGGPYEEGKDIIFWEKDKFDRTTLSVAQVKFFKFSAKSNSDKTLTEVLVQIKQCKKEILYTDGHHYTPSEIILFNPYNIDNRELQAALVATDDAIKNYNVRIFSGFELANIIHKTIPNITNDLLGVQFGITNSLCDTFGNEELLDALNHEYKVDISRVYNDLEFSLGNKEQDILAQTIEINNTEIEITSNESEDYRALYIKIMKSINQKLTNIAPDELETELRSKLAATEKHYILSNKLQAKYLDCVKLLRSKTEELSSYSFNEANINNRIDIDNLCQDIFALTYSMANDEEKIDYYKKRIFNIYNRLQGDGHIWSESIIQKTVIASNSALSQYTKFRKQTKQTQNQKIKVKIRTSAIIKEYNKLKNSIIACIKELNESHNTLKVDEILSKIVKFRELLDILSTNSLARKVFNIVPQSDTTRSLKISIHKFFDSHRDILVLGEAGSGKTTSLLMYARNMHCKKTESSKTIYIPLNRVLKACPHEEKLTLNRFFKSLETFIKTKTESVTHKSLLNFLHQNTCTLLLDGIDEVANTHQDIFDMIKQLKSQMPHNQLIASSRFNTGTDTLGFINIHLLPFKPNQRNQFIKDWFNKKIDKHKVIITHLDNNPYLAKTINNPLLATVLCVLAENNIPMPVDECELYEQRLNLLLGHYDLHKKVRRIITPQKDLEFIARKIAFTLHNFGVRHLPKKDLLKSIQNKTSKYSKEAIETAIKELYTPCNVISSMTNQGDLGFGHLRFQEHLAALDLKNNPGSNITRYMTTPWWRGAMVLYAMMADSIDFVASDINKKGNVGETIGTYSAMVNARPEGERQRLRSYFEGYDDAQTQAILFQANN